MRLVTAGYENIRAYLDDEIGSNDCPIHEVATLATVFVLLAFHKLVLSSDKFRIRARRVNVLRLVNSADGVHSNDDRVDAMPMPFNIKQLRN